MWLNQHKLRQACPGQMLHEQTPAGQSLSLENPHFLPDRRWRVWPSAPGRWCLRLGCLCGRWCVSHTRRGAAGLWGGHELSEADALSSLLGDILSAMHVSSPKSPASSLMPSS